MKNFNETERNKKLAGIIQESVQINEDFKTTAKKFISQGASAENVDRYFKKFKQIKDKGKKYLDDQIDGLEIKGNDRLDIDKYQTFKELELFVDYMEGMINLPSEVEASEMIETDGKAVYSKDGLEVFYANTPRACIKYKGSFPYSWCVARDAADNMFFHYRLGEREPAFYFVKNKERVEKEFSKNVDNKSDFKDKYHFFVVQVPKDLDASDKNAEQFIVTSAKNDGDTPMSWNQLVKIEPKLKDALHIFEPKPHTEEEEKMKKYEHGLDDEAFSKLSYADKSLYLDVYVKQNRRLTDKQFSMLPEELKNKYLTLRVPLSFGQYEVLKKSPKLLQRYHEIVKKKYQDIIAKKTKEHLNDLEAEIVFDIMGIEKTQFLKDLQSMEMVDFIVKYAGSLEDVAEDSYNDDKLTITLDRSDFKDLFGSEFYYDSFSGYGAFDGIYVEDDEIQHYFTDEQWKKLKTIIKMYGEDPKKYDYDTHNIHDFLNDHGMEKLVKNMTSEISYEGGAKAREIGGNVQNEYPMDYDSTRNGYEIHFTRDAIKNFIITNSLYSVENLEEFLQEYGNRMGDVFSSENYVEIEQEGMSEFDRTYLENMVNDYLDEMLDSGIGIRHQKVVDELQKLDIDSYNKKQDSKYEIEVLNYNPKNYEDGEDMEDPEIEISLYDKERDKKYQGVVKMSNLPNYMYNYQLFELKQIIKDIIKERWKK